MFGLFCLYCCTSPFSVSGTLNNLLPKGVDCSEIGRTCSGVVQILIHI